MRNKEPVKLNRSKRATSFINVFFEADLTKAQTRLTCTQTLEKAVGMAEAHGVATIPRFQELIRDAIHAVLTPMCEEPLDAAEYLRVQGHSELEVARLATKFGKWLKARYLAEGACASDGDSSVRLE